MARKLDHFFRSFFRSSGVEKTCPYLDVDGGIILETAPSFINCFGGSTSCRAYDPSAWGAR